VQEHHTKRSFALPNRSIDPWFDSIDRSLVRLSHQSFTQDRSGHGKTHAKMATSIEAAAPAAGEGRVPSSSAEEEEEEEEEEEDEQERWAVIDDELLTRALLLPSISIIQSNGWTEQGQTSSSGGRQEEAPADLVDAITQASVVV
jgi:hypothetical protein